MFLKRSAKSGFEGGAIAELVEPGFGGDAAEGGLGVEGDEAVGLVGFRLIVGSELVERPVGDVLNRRAALVVTVKWQALGGGGGIQRIPALTRRGG